MSQSELVAMSDEQLVSVIERLSEESSKCEITKKYNRLALEWKRAWDVLRSRGPDAVKKLLPLLSSVNQRVRLDVAKVCYPLSPEECHRVIVELERMSNPSIASEAMIFLYDHDEEFRKKLSDEADRAYGRDWRHPK